MGFEKRKLKDPKTLRLFFSSPFGGMEEEREELTRMYFPQFEHLCNSNGIQFVPVDMRWGITTEAANNAQVVNICLKEIDRSDIFIGFFGQRYGWHGESDELLQRNIDNALAQYPWLANFRGKSVTELEFLHGHLNNPGLLPASICFRDKAYDDDIKQKCQAKGDNSKAVKYTAESELSTSLMSDLIKRVKETEPLCLGLLVNYEDPKEGAKFMFESVWECCKELVFSSETQSLSSLEQNRLCHDTFVSFRTSLYFGAESYLTQLTPDKLKEHPTVLVKGSAGSGKSSLLANLVKLLKENDIDLHLVYYFVGSAQGTTGSKNILLHILAELQHINSTECNNQDIADTQKSISNDFHSIYLSVKTELAHASQDGKKILIIIDGLEKVKSYSKTEKHLYWLPEQLPVGIYLIVSTENSDHNTINLLSKQRNFYELEIYPLEDTTQIQISKETLMIKGKELSPYQQDRIVKAEQTKNPLFLKIVLSEISIYGNFRLLDKKIDSLIYSEGVKDLLTKVLERLEGDYNVKDSESSLVQQVMSALAVCQHGLSEGELVDMFNLNSSSWSSFYFSIENFFIIHEGLLRFAFSELKNAVVERYMQNPEAKLAIVKLLITFFEKQKKDVDWTVELLNSLKIKRIAEELPYLQNSIGDKHGLINTLSDIRVFCALERKSVYELRDLWAATDCKQDTIVQYLFASFDMALTHLYNYQVENDLTHEAPPGYVLMPVLNSMKRFFTICSYYRATIKTIQRITHILESIRDKIPEEERVSVLREKKYLLACAYVDNTEYEKAQELHESVMAECKKLMQQNKDDKSVKQTLAYTCNGLGILHLRQQHYVEAEPFLLESYKLHAELGNELSTAEAIQNLGIAKLDTGYPENALQDFHKAMEVFETFYFGHLPIEVGNLLTNMALCYRRMNDIDKAESMYQRSLEVKAQAVGWSHEVIATCYMNLGALEFYRKNYIKAEEYTRKAIDILEQNEVKMEQNEMWQAQENLVLNLICQNRWEEALPIFLKVFKVLKQENQLDQAAVSVHKEMIRYMTHIKMFHKAAKVALSHINSPKQRQPIFYVLLDYCDRQATQLAEKPPPKRSEAHTIAYALEEIWPGNNELTAYIAQNYVVPENDMETLLKLVRKLDEMNPGFEWTCYKVAEEWCGENKEAAVMILKEGLAKYPNASFLKSRLFDCLRLLKRYSESYSLLRDVIASEPDNQALVLVAGDVACKAGDLELCMELWEKASIMPDKSLAEKAKEGMKTLSDVLKDKENNV